MLRMKLSRAGVFAIVAVLFAALQSRADVKSVNATLADPPTHPYMPGGIASDGDTFMHAWGSLLNANGSQPGTPVYVDFVTNNDGTGWSVAAGKCNAQNIIVSYFSDAANLTGPTVANCMTDFGGSGTEGGWSGDSETWKSAGMLVVNGVLYLSVLRQQDGGSFLGDHATIMKSLNGGRSWCWATKSDCMVASNNGAPPTNGMAEFCDPVGSSNCSKLFVNIHFVQYERDAVPDSINQDDENTYIYGFASDSKRMNYYLMRINRSADLQIATNWYYYTGPSGGSVTAAGVWTQFGTSGSGKPSSCAGVMEPGCGATIVFTNDGAAGSNGGPIWTGTDFGYLIGSGNNTRSLYISKTLTGDTAGKWRRQIFAAPTLIPSNRVWAPTPIIDDFPEPVLSTLSVANPGTGNATAHLLLSSSGDYTNSSHDPATNNYAMFTAPLTLYAAAQEQNFYCNPVSALPNTSPNIPQWVSYFGNDTYNSNGPSAQVSDQSGHYPAVTLPLHVNWVTNGIGFHDTANSDVFELPYTADATGDFTLFVVYNRSNASNKGNAYERIVDKSSGSAGANGFTIQRMDTTANTWCFYVGGVGGCDTIHFTDGNDNLMAMRRRTVNGTSELSVWSSDPSVSSSSAPLLSVNVSSVANPAPTATNLFLGNSQQLVNPFEGTISAFVYYKNGLSDADAATAQRAVQDEMFCAARKIVLPGVTANN